MTPAPDAGSRPAGKLRRLLTAAVALAAVAGLAVAAAPASASAASAPAATVATAHRAVAAAPASRVAARPAADSRAVSPRAGRAVGDVRRVCAAPKRGFAACMSLLRTNVPAHRGLFTHDTTPPGYGPPDLQSAYSLPSATAGSGKTVAIVDAYDDPNAAADLATYRAQFGLPACTTASGCFEKVNQEGQQGSYPAPDAGWATEESLDVDMVSAVCPSCHILLVEANSNSGSDMYAAEDEAVALGAKYVSNSWTSSEYSGETQADQYFNHPGVVITAAAGDSGYGVNYPAASPYVTAVGGTTLTKDSGVPRGWTETAWGSASGGEGTGSGCSQYEPKPAWQHDSGCANRTVADVSAVADPNTGVAMYDSYSQSGWLVVGGTSVATPVIASTYALAGAPEQGTNPASYPYLHSTGLNDVTSGADGTCTPSYLCTAGPGYDGPTGLGTPDGVTAFQPVGAGTVAGTVTDAATGKPVAGAEVDAGGFSASTNASGQYALTVAAGSYTVTARAFGYAEKTVTGVTVAQGQTATENFTLATAASVTLSGTVTDGSGHGWPLYAKITIGGDPGGPVYTSPFTGRYSVSLPGQTSYTLTVAPAYPGYAAKTVTVPVGTSSVQQNMAVTVDTSACDAPGYAPSGGSCGLVPGGLVAGVVTDANTGKPVDGATVTSTASSSASGTTAATGDPALAGGFYWLFSSPAGATAFAAAHAGYHSAAASVDVTASAVTRRDFSLKAGQLVITPGSVSATETLGQSATARITFRNTGSAPVHVGLGVQDGGFTPLGQQAGTRGAPLRVIKSRFPGMASAGTRAGARAQGASALQATAPGSAARSAAAPYAWASIAPYPMPVAGNAVAYDPQDGELYSVGGHNSITTTGVTTANGYAYDPSANTWSPIAPAPQPLTGARAVFIDGTLYLTGGYAGAGPGSAGIPSAAVYAYHPGSDSWSQAASLPRPVEWAGTAVLDGQLYVVGGCTSASPSPWCSFGPTLDTVYRYDPADNTWTRLADYPVIASQEACAGIDGQVVCAGGYQDAVNGLTATYLYDPATNSWSKGADMPVDDFSMAYAGANGKLQIAGGFVRDNSAVTNQAWQYDPVTNSWSTLPNDNAPAWASGGGCGFYVVGGNAGFTADTAAEVLPGFDRCDGAGDVSWLSKTPAGFSLAPGRSVTVTVSLDSARLDQPGTYAATLWAAASDPYPVQMAAVAMHVTPPRGWALVHGTVTGPGGQLAPGATIALSRFTGTAPGLRQTLPGGVAAGPAPATAAVKTNADGAYQWWLSGGYAPLLVSAARDGYQPQARIVTGWPRARGAVGFALTADPGSPVYHPAPGPAARPARHGARPAGRPVRPAAAGSAGALGPALARLAAGDVKRVCAAPKRGFASCMSLLRTNVPAHRGLFGHDTAPSGYGPPDLQSAYSLPSATAGGGQTVAIVDAYDDPNAAADLQLYRQQYGLPACTTASGCFEKVNQQGQQGSYPAPNAGWATEESLDVDMVSAICPACHIILVEANSAVGSDLYAAEDEAVALGAKYVSNSWATGEYSSETQDDQYFNHPGVVITAAGGDSGYLGRGGLDNYPATSQYVTAVGGTTLTRDSSVSRGWAETVWGSAAGGEGTGSGCSLYEAKPAWQHDTGCANRTTNDVSAVANPNTGVAVYDSYGQSGWLVVGGTSVATPIIASTYALAGSPEAGTYPSSYPYLHSTGLNDVTSGANGTCTPAYLCTAGPGYDGPTGLGTPAGVSAFTPVNAGKLSGTVTDAGTGKPVAGATISIGSISVTTSGSGQYTIFVAPGSYTVTVQAFGYAEQTATGVQVTQGQTTTENFALTTVPHVTVSGTVTDGSGHGWPLLAEITVTGTPLAPAYTDPYTGRYSISLPAQASYTLQVAPLDPGYAATTVTVAVGTAGVRQNIAVPASWPGCIGVSGYAQNGIYQTFTGWSQTPRAGWAIDTTTQQGWGFTGSGASGNTGGSGGYAIAFPAAYSGANEDTSLVSPVVDLSGDSSPEIGFNTVYLSYNTVTAEVDLSLDGGQTWQSVWRQTGNISGGPGPVDIPVPQAAGHSDVRVRFGFTGGGESVWEVSNVVVGSRNCVPRHGGLVDGVVTDANTGQPVNGATVASATKPGQPGVSAATGDPALPGGFYSMFSPHTGATTFTAADGGYATATAAVNVAANGVTRQDWALNAGRLTVSTGSLSATQTLGQSATAKVILGNTGTAPLRVAIGTQDGSFAPVSQPGAQALGAQPPRNPPGVITKPGLTEAPPRVAARAAAGGSAWQSIPYPIPILHNATAYDPLTGDVYSVGGTSNEDVFMGVTTARGYVYSPSAGKWSPIAPLPQPLRDSAAAFVDGSMYVAGGFFNRTFNPVSAVYAYNPAADSWAQVASLPEPVSDAAAAVLGGRLYIIGGFIPGGETNAVYRYDPGPGTWTQLAGYPLAVTNEACGGIDGEIVCAGGFTGNQGNGGNVSATYIYDPASNTWSQGADMPYSAYGMGYSAAGGQLQVMGGETWREGRTAGSILRSVSQYDPATNTWTALPSLPVRVEYAGAACGLYVVGGGTGIGYTTTRSAETLPGYGQCDGAGDTAWLSANPAAFTLAPGQSVTVTVTLDSAQVAQPGTFTASLFAEADTPYLVKPVAVTMQVSPPGGWGLLQGTVSGASGHPVQGATVEIGTRCAFPGRCGPAAYTVKTGPDGSYQWWLPARGNPLQVIAARDGYVQQVRMTGVNPFRAVTLNYALRGYLTRAP